MIELSEPKIYEFEEFRLDEKSHKLFRRAGRELVPLTPKAVDLLIYLVRNAGKILTKEDLLNAVWENSFIEEANLSQTIFVLRKTLGENKKTPRFILTVPSRGYQFIATVSEIKSDKPVPQAVNLSQTNVSEPPESKVNDPAAVQKSKKKNYRFYIFAVPLVVLFTAGVYWFYFSATKPVSVREIKTIAVLPFEDLSAGQTEKYLGVGLADALANKLGNLRQITVRPTRTVLRYAESRDDIGKIGRELQVDAVLDGRIQRVGEQVRISVQLIRTADNTTIWTENFDDQFTNFFALQDSISQKVVESLALKIDDQERQKLIGRGTENKTAYQEYLLGRFFWNKRSADDLNRAVEHFNRAVELDANFAQAYAGLAETFAIYPFYSVVDDKDALPKARRAAIRALEINGELAEAHTALAYVRAQYDFDWRGAEKSYLRAIELNPNQPTTRQWYGEFLAFQNRIDESLAQMQKAIELDPTSLSTNAAPALAYNASRQFEKTLEATDKVLQMDADFIVARHYKARALFFLGRQSEALEMYRKIVASSNGSAYFKADLAYLYGKAGNPAEARRILQELTETAREKHVSPYCFAIVHIGLGENEKAFEYLRKAVAEHDNNVIVMKVGINFDSVRADPQFIEILRSANFQ